MAVSRSVLSQMARRSSLTPNAQNVKEIEAVMHIARRYTQQGKSFRIITPYDAQRAQLEKALQREYLPWESKCFCVDSFQGKSMPVV